MSAQDGAKRRLIFALDVESVAEAKSYVSRLSGEVGLFKVGKQLFLQAGPPIVHHIVRHGGRVFLDLKFHDIPRTVAGAGIEAARLRVAMFNVHASGGFEMMRLAREGVRRACRLENLSTPLMLAVTVLTSLDHSDLKHLGLRMGVTNQVVRLARMAANARLDGVVASPLELTPLRRACGNAFVLVVPGIRPAGSASDDQKRVLTPREAMRGGADYIVVGKSIRDARDPRTAARQIVREMEAGLLSIESTQRSRGGG